MERAEKHLIKADWVLTGDGETVLEKGAVVLEGKRILAVGEAARLERKFPEAQIQELKGCTLMPGLIDMHTHIGWEKDDRPDRYGIRLQLLALSCGKRMEETIQAGVTTVRDVGSPDGVVPALKEAAKAGYIRSPRIFTGLRALCMTGGHGAESLGVKEVDGVSEIRKAVRENLQKGADLIKLMDSEGYRGEEFSQEELDAAVAEAHRFHVRVAAHAGYDPSMKMCIQAGCDTIEHGTHLTVEEALRMKENDQTWVPTMYVFHYVYEQVKQSQFASMAEHIGYLEDAVESYREHFKELYDTGVRVAAGTDTECAGHPQASTMANECQLMVTYGITPVQAVCCATHHGAEALGMGTELGLLKEGYLADLTAVRGNVSEKIEALSAVEAVWQEGTCVYESESALLHP